MADPTQRMQCQRGGEGPTVVLVHGIPGRGSVWNPVVDELMPSFDVITVDLLGFGASDGFERPSLENVGPAAQAAALADLLDALEVRSATIVGHDFGAPIAVLLASSRPDLVAGLGLVAGNTFPDTPIPFPLSVTTFPVLGPLVSRLLFSRPSLALMLRRGVGEGPRSPDPHVYLGDGRQQRTIAAIFSGALSHLRETYAPVAAALESLDLPVRVVWGGRDPFFPVEQGRRTATAARGTLRVLEGAGHFLPHERPAELARLVTELVAAAR